MRPYYSPRPQQESVTVVLDYDDTKPWPWPAIPAIAVCPFCGQKNESLPANENSGYWYLTKQRCRHARMLMSTGRIGEGSVLFEGYHHE